MSEQLTPLSAPPPADPPRNGSMPDGAGSLDAGDAVVLARVLDTDRKVDKLAERLDRIETAIKDPLTRLAIAALALVEVAQAIAKALGKG